jgi:hypothetical protein
MRASVPRLRPGRLSLVLRAGGSPLALFELGAKKAFGYSRQRATWC